MSDGRRALVVAIFPNTRGFGYAAFEDSLPIDWGVSDVQGANRNQTCIRRVAALLAKYNLDVLLLRDPAETRGQRVSALIEAIAALPRHQGVGCFMISRIEVRKAFKHIERPTRQRIAHVIAQRVPFLEPLVPPPRKIWNSEDRRMGLFDAIALALTYLDDGLSIWPSGA